jgi:hypothetical protein
MEYKRVLCADGKKAKILNIPEVVIITILVVLDFFLLHEVFALNERVDYLAELSQIKSDYLIRQIKKEGRKNDE